MSIRNPKKLFIENLKITEAVGIVLTIGIVHGLSDILSKDFSISFRLKEQSIVSVGLYPIFMSVLFVLFGGIGVAVEALWVKIIFRVLKKELNYLSLLSAVTFTLVPLLLRDFLVIIWPGLLVTIQTAGQTKLSFYKTSLAQMFANNCYGSSTFIFLTQVEIFGIWSFIIGTIAVSVIGRVSYIASFLIILSYWLLSSLIYTIYVTA